MHLYIHVTVCLTFRLAFSASNYSYLFIYNIIIPNGLYSNKDKGHRVLFMDKKVYLWAKDTDLISAVQIGVWEGGLYKAS